MTIEVASALDRALLLCLHAAHAVLWNCRPAKADIDGEVRANEIRSNGCCNTMVAVTMPYLYNITSSQNNSLSPYNVNLTKDIEGSGAIAARIARTPSSAAC